MDMPKEAEVAVFRLFRVEGVSNKSPTLVPAKDATCTEEGNKAYYICDRCDKWFEDAQGKSEITDKTSVIIPAAGHTLSDWKADDNSHGHECECGYKAYVAQHSKKRFNNYINICCE